MTDVKQAVTSPMDALESTAEECDCAPTAAERRRLWVPFSRRTALALAGVGAVTLGVGLSGAGSAFAVTYNPDDYPSWEDVERAKRNQSDKEGEIRRLEDMIAQLQRRVEETRAAAQQAANEYYEAQQAFFEASYRAEELQKQADEQAALADTAATNAARVASQLSRAGGDGTSLEVLFAGSAASADELLTKLGQMDKLIAGSETIYAEAAAARDSAQSLSDQAEVARAERDRLQKIAEEKMIAAQNAQIAAEEALAQQQEHMVTLEAQLAALRDTTSKTVADYEKGVAAKKAYEEEQRRKEEERRRKAAEEAARRAREAAAAAAAAAKPSGGGGSPAPASSGGAPQGSGWARPSDGWRTSGYGSRPKMCGPSYCGSTFHAGVDLAAGCGAPIYAAANGTVTYAGLNGGYGNYIRLDHGNGVGTGYAHIVGGGILVGWGQYVRAGQVIAYEGNTGNSFGCHLHFEVYLGGAPTNPIPWMADRGVYV
ncbi:MULTISPECIES: peptidoglycan DD-metalloendopeptidase family protein [unclassified Microbacterium]|uniref:peptidoglycan DD-metalloendopeptidase family protein n=1 Tax=unclassified Microbacterium TaxID=2609290 RepID=UPI000A5A586F|nr:MULTISPECIES: peptidoglycan DD-metalloendopeptidase family protein [unclassified Microbacterium]